MFRRLRAHRVLCGTRVCVGGRRCILQMAKYRLQNRLCGDSKLLNFGQGSRAVLEPKRTVEGCRRNIKPAAELTQRHARCRQEHAEADKTRRNV